MPNGEEIREEKTTAQKLQDTVNMQSNEYDKLWLYLSNAALWGLMDDASKLSEEQKSQLETDPNAVMGQKQQVPFDPMQLYADDDPFIKCKQLMYLMGVMEAKFALELGNEQLSLEQSMEGVESDPVKRSEKAAFLMKNAEPKTMRMYQEFDSMRRMLLSAQEGLTRQAFLAGDNPVDENTTMGQLADKMGLYHDNRTAFMRKFGCTDENKKAMAVFKNRLKDRIDAEKKKNKNVQDVKLANSKADDASVMFYMIKNCNEHLVQEWNAKGYHSVKNTVFGAEEEMFEKGRALQSKKNPAYANIQNWIRDKGAREAEKKKAANISDASKQLISALTSEKPQKIRSTRGMNDVFPEELFQKQPEFLSGVIAKFESTKTGTSIDRFLWHRKNSGQYEAMLKAVKAYEKALLEKKSGEAADRREEMLEKCYAYIEGKEKIRWHDFGKERYNLALMLIRQYDSMEKFNALCEKINRVREVQPEHEDHMSAGALNEFERTYGIKDLGKNRIHEKTRKNVTLMHPAQEKRFAVMETLYTKDPQYLPTLKIGFKENEFGKLKKIDKKFHKISNNAIGKNAQPEGDGLSGKDFAAIAYGASLSGNAAGKAPGCFPKGVEKKDIPELFSDRYTSIIMKKDGVPLAAGKTTPVIQYGREKAQEALKEYGEGKKKKLAAILANALVKITEKYKIKSEVDDELVADGEMAGRMSNMLLRDDGLLQEALNSNTGFCMGHLRMVSSINTACELYARSTYAKEKIAEAVKSGKDTMSPDEKKQLMTDVVSYMTVKEWMDKRTRVLFGDINFTRESDQLTQDQGKAKEATDKARENLKKKTNGSLANLKKEDEKTFEKIQAEEADIRALYNGKKKLLKKKYVKNSVMIDQMKETEAIDRIHRESAKLVQSSLRNLNVAGQQLTPAKMQEILSGMETRIKHVAQPQAGDGRRIAPARGINN